MNNRQFGNMSKRSWTDMFFPFKRSKTKRAKPVKFKKELSLYVVKSIGFMCHAYTKSEARSVYKSENGRIPPGTIFEKVA